MSDGTGHTHHGIDYTEIYVLDMEAAQAFYAAAFGWQFSDYGPAYAGIKKPGGGEYGGLCVVPEVRPGGALVVLYSDDVDASCASVEAAGGTITKPMFEFPGGRRFHFTDPSGNELGVWGA